MPFKARTSTPSTSILIPSIRPISRSRQNESSATARTRPGCAGTPCSNGKVRLSARSRRLEKKFTVPSVSITAARSTWTLESGRESTRSWRIEAQNGSGSKAYTLPQGPTRREKSSV